MADAAPEKCDCELLRVSSRTSSGGSSTDSRSFENGHQKTRNGIRSGNKGQFMQSHQDIKPPSSLSVHVPHAPTPTQEQCNKSFWEATALHREIDLLSTELFHAQNTIHTLKDREQKLKNRLAEQAQRMLERGAKFENVALGEKRPTALVRNYGNLYTQARVDTLDALDTLAALSEADELKSKILFSVVVLAFRTAQNTLTDLKHNIRCLLQIPDSPGRSAAATDLESAVSIYLRHAADAFDLSRNVNEVCSQIYATLYDYPCLRSCSGLINYVKDCVRLSWCLSNQNPPYMIEYETRTFRRDMHVRFHTSNQSSDVIKNYLWPALMEGETGPCVHKGVVLT